MADPIDPRLQFSALPPRSLAQSYTAGPPQPLHTSASPYYLPAPNNGHHAQLQTGPATIDPALEQTSPAGQDSSHDEDDHDDGDHDGITTPPTRKRQKKADSRVAELERKIDALTATLHAQKGAPEPPRPYPGMPHYEGGPSPFTQPEGAYRAGTIAHDWSNSPSTQERYPDIPAGYGPAQSMQRGPEAKRRKLGDGSGHAPTIPEDMDAVHRDLIEHIDMKRTGRKGVHTDHSNINTLVDSLMSPETAERIFQRYVNEICPHFPAVPLPPGTSARDLREKKPLLFLSILAGSSHGAAEQLVSQDVQRDLTKILKDQFADIIWRNGEKSLEVVQALQVGVLWYRPPLHYEQHNFYMMVNCAAVMALDLGLGRRNTPTVMKLAVGPFRRCHPNTSSIESRRTFLVCYYLCMSITMVLRRPILLRWTKYMEESVKILETSPEALPSDKVLCQHVKMAHIGENISVQFCMDDPSVEVAISEPKVIYALKIFENELQQLRDENASLFKDVDPALRLAEHVTNLYMHEIALHHNQSPADFQPPFPQEAFTSGVSTKEAVGPAHIGALGECLTATHGILDTILSVPLDILLTLPVIFCVRAIYAIVCLMKMWVSVTSSGEVGNIINKDLLQIETYTERLVTMFNAIVSRDAQSPHGKFYFVAKRLQERFAHIKEGATKTEQSSDANEDSRSSTAKSTSKPRSRQSSQNQTPLHLLSEVAMGSSNTASSQPQTQPQQHAPQMQQTQAPPQATMQGWYPSIPGQQLAPDMMGMPQGNFDPNFDFTQFDLSTGSDADLSALFIPDSMAWNFPPDMGLSGYGAF
ncbi:hypothetical protein N0V90_005263 [Kalmusia sp. IMI 367209]|nr:hypothetical protein N0V90_005263 [Kalmusia sp. IMI 367209]